MARGTKNLKKRGKKLTNTNHTKNQSTENFAKGILRQSGWNKNLTLRQNFAVVGLQMDPNVDLRKKSKRDLPEKLIERYRKYNLGELLNKEVDTKANLYCEGQTAAKKSKYYLTEDEIRYLRPLIEKYDEDITKMFFDIELNTMQKTKGWLKRKVHNFKNYSLTKELS